MAQGAFVVVVGDPSPISIVLLLIFAVCKPSELIPLLPKKEALVCAMQLFVILILDILKTAIAVALVA